MTAQHMTGPETNGEPNAPLAKPRRSSSTRRPGWSTWLLVTGNVIAAAAFCWPLVVPALPQQARDAAPIAALAVIPFAAVALGLALDGRVRSAKTLALLGTLTAIGTATRVAGAGVGGVELVFVLLILAGRAYGARFGFLLGMLTIALSSTVFGGFGPWTPFQMFACGWVGAGAALIPGARTASVSPSRGRRMREAGILALYGALASYAFGLIMNLWFWPFAVGTGTDISYAPGAPLGQNLASFGLYTLVTSTLTWDTLRAITTVVGILVAGPAALAALRRAKLSRPGRRLGGRTPAAQFRSGERVAPEPAAGDPATHLHS
ncbi:ECF transporter S component [Orlajensenia flava]|nr:ECF transporter S component [Glaciibacter flavus]